MTINQNNALISVENTQPTQLFLIMNQKLSVLDNESEIIQVVRDFKDFSNLTQVNWTRHHNLIQPSITQ